VVIVELVAETVGQVLDEFADLRFLPVVLTLVEVEAVAAVRKELLDGLGRADYALDVHGPWNLLLVRFESLAGSDSAVRLQVSRPGRQRLFIVRDERVARCDGLSCQRPVDRVRGKDP
jgi:hypothetical protein